MSTHKKCGILLNISSLPSPYGIGSLGKQAYDFVDFLNRTKQTYWQVLPLCQTSYGDSPYQSPSAFAGNPYFIDLDILRNEGLLTDSELTDLDTTNDCDERYVDYGKIFATRYDVLRKAFSRFVPDKEYEQFVIGNAFWLADYSDFMAIKVKSGFVSFLDWEKKYLTRRSDSLAKFRRVYCREIDFWKFVQYEFFKQYFALKSYANGKGVRIIGDMPIYVALDSAEVWAHGEYFLLKDHKPKLVAGVPPDAFASDGQLWGNPIYDWNYLAKNGYAFWVQRIAFAKEMYDLVRIDHFRGFKSFYAIPSKDTNARNGKWKKGPGVKLFDEIKKHMPVDFIIAEDLGYLTKGVRSMLVKTGFPGMKVLQFGFSGNPADEYLPEAYKTNSIAYTGTHDNMTAKQFVDSMPEWQRCFFRNQLSAVDEECDVDKMIGAVLGSRSKIAIVPIQDYLCLGEVARMNYPSKTNGYWRWRLACDQLSSDLERKIKSMAVKYHRD